MRSYVTGHGLRKAVLAALLLPACASPPAASGHAADGAAAIEAAVAARASGVAVEVTAEVMRLLGDDREGSRHQRFLLRLPAGATVLVAHNIDLAERVPAAVGDRVTVSGRYEWNPKGGVIHWTHRDPRGQQPGGHIEHAGRRYQ